MSQINRLEHELEILKATQEKAESVDLIAKLQNKIEAKELALRTLKGEI